MPAGRPSEYNEELRPVYFNLPSSVVDKLIQSSKELNISRTKYLIYLIQHHSGETHKVVKGILDECNKKITKLEEELSKLRKENEELKLKLNSHTTPSGSGQHSTPEAGITDALSRLRNYILEHEDELYEAWSNRKRSRGFGGEAIEVYRAIISDLAQKFGISSSIVAHEIKTHCEGVMYERNRSVYRQPSIRELGRQGSESKGIGSAGRNESIAKPS